MGDGPEPGDEGRPAREAHETREPHEERGRSAFARRLVWVALICLLGLWTIVSLWPAASSDRVEPVPFAQTGANGTASPPDPKPADDAEALPPAVQRYLDANVYPPGAGRLLVGQTDLLEPNQRFEDFRPILDTYSPNPDEVVSVRLTTDHYFYTGEEDVLLDLQIKQGERRIDPISLDASATREGRAGPEGARIPIRFHRDGDAFTAKLETAAFADHHGPIVVDARIEYWPGAFYDESLRFFYTPSDRIPARFTGEVEDALSNGSLRIQVGIDVEMAGYYRIDANLYDHAGHPVAFSAFKGELDRSDVFVPIEFFGRILRDANAIGPYSVGEIRGYRFLEGEYPDRERIPDLPGRHPTADYALSRLSEAEYQSEHKTRMVQLLLEDVANGISIDLPPEPGNENPVGETAPPTDGPAPDR